MRKKCMILILAGCMALSMYGCGNEKMQEDASAPAESIQAETDVEVSADSIKAETEQPGDSIKTEAEPAADISEDASETEGKDVEDLFSFAEFKNLQFCFASGAGGWATMLTIDQDGSFLGEYFDGEMGDIGEDYPNGTMYQSNFSGQFSQPERVNDYTYSMRIREINYEEAAGSEEIIDGVRYCYSEAYGLEDAEEILIYLPGAPLEELPQEFRGWVGYYDLSDTEDTQLPFYALNNEVSQCGFSSYNIVDGVKEMVTAVQEQAVLLENSVQNDPLTQAEYNEKTKELYDLWDAALNRVWEVLKQTLDEDAMSALTVEEREWVAAKEQAVAEAGAEFEGGSIQPMIVNQKAAELTKARVYELLELLD